jgi:hypothetical protein
MIVGEDRSRVTRVIRRDEIAPIVESSNYARVYPLARVAEGSSSASATWVEIDGRHRRLSSTRSTRLYVVVTGDLTFHLEQEGPLRLTAGDALEIPRHCAYDLEGTATYLVINTPAFEEGDDVYH